MLSFVVFEPDAESMPSALASAHLVGPENVPIAGEISYEHGLVRCVKTTREAAGLAMQIDLGLGFEGSFAGDVSILDPGVLEDIRTSGEPAAGVALRSPGRLMLETCLLPERGEPYLLSLELARRRLMLFLNCQEEWQLFALAPQSPILRLFERARLTFTEALVAPRTASDGHAGGFSPEAHRLAMRALILSIWAGECLTLHNAATDFTPRTSGGVYARTVERLTGAPPKPRQMRPVVSPDRAGVVLPTRPAVGCAISPGVQSEGLQQIVKGACDFISVPMRWRDMEPGEGRYAFADTDRWIEWAVRRAKMPVVAGPLIDFRASCVPDWLYIWENDYDTLRDLVYEHVRTIVTRYRRTITRWTVVSGLHSNENFQLSFEQMMDLTRVCVYVVRKLHPQAKVQVEIAHPWGEYHTTNRRSLPPTLYAEMLSQAGIQLDAFALRVQTGAPEDGLGARDLMSLSAMLDQYAALDKPISVSAVGSPSAMVPPPDTDDTFDESVPLDPGAWWAPWNPVMQADWLSAALSVAATKPYVQSVCWHELSDASTRPEMPNGGLVDANGVSKPATARLGELRDALRVGIAPPRLGVFAGLNREVGSPVQAPTP